MVHKFKVGDTVVRRNTEHGGVSVGQHCRVTAVKENANEYQLSVGANGFWHDADNLSLVAPTKSQRLIAAKEAELARLKEAAAKRAKDAAARKAKAERAKVLAGLSAAGKRVVAMLQAGSASDFGCQRDNVILLAAAITGDKADAIEKALA